MIQVLGWYNHDNIGDEAYKIAFPKLLKNDKLVFNEEIQGSPEVVILGGGDVLQPSFFQKLDTVPNAKKYALSVNLRKDEANHPKLNQFKKVVSRNYVPQNSKITFCPDFTFALEANKDNGKQLVRSIFKKHGSDLYDNLVIVTLNCFLCRREKQLARDFINFEKISFDLARLMDSTSASFLFVPFGNGFPENDRISNAFAYTNSKFWKKNVLLFEKLTVQQTLDVFAAADAAISTRLHSGIFSCIAGIPFVDISHHSKTELFMEFIGKQDWCLNYWHFDFLKCHKLIKEFLSSKELFKNQVSTITRNAREILHRVIDPKILE